jgi:hypothetical protein
MLYALLICLVFVNVAYLIARDRDAKRNMAQAETDRLERAAVLDAHRADVTALREQAEREAVAHREELVRVFTDHRAEVQALCQRLQAPELAVIAHQQEASTPDEEMPLTDDQVAELQDRELALERIERMQREGMLT